MALQSRRVRFTEAERGPLMPLPQVDRGYAGLALSLFVVTLMLCLTAEWFYMPVPIGVEDQAALAEGSLIGKVMWLPVFGLAGWIVLRRYELVLLVLRQSNLLLMAFIGFSIVSVLWSQDSGATLRRAVKLSGVFTLAVAFVVAAWRPLRFERWLRYFLLSFVAASLLVVVLMPEAGRHQDSALYGNWRGLTSSKNTLGMMCAVTGILWVHAWAAGRARLRTILPALLLTVVTLIGAQSTTSLLLMVLGSALMLALLRSPFDLDGQGAALLLGAVLALVVPLFMFMIATGSVGFLPVLQAVTEAIGKDVTLTGRADIWVLVLEAYGNWPWLGAGYGAFWLGADVGGSRTIAELLYWVPHQAHNGYLDVLNEGGIVGLTLLIGYLMWFVWALARFWQVDPNTAALHIVLFVYVLISNVSESDFFRPMMPMFVIHLFSAMEIARHLFEHRLRVTLHERTEGHRAGPIPGLRVYRGPRS